MAESFGSLSGHQTMKQSGRILRSKQKLEKARPLLTSLLSLESELLEGLLPGSGLRRRFQMSKERHAHSQSTLIMGTDYNPYFRQLLIFAMPPDSRESILATATMETDGHLAIMVILQDDDAPGVENKTIDLLDQLVDEALEITARLLKDLGM